jgi:phage-related protein
MSKIIPTNYFKKKQDKTNQREIEKALDRLDDWLERKGK